VTVSGFKAEFQPSASKAEIHMKGRSIDLWIKIKIVKGGMAANEI